MRRLFWNTVVSSLDTAILLLLSLIATPILINNFGAEVFGVFVFLNIFSIYGALSFFDLGMEGALMTQVARYDVANKFADVNKALGVALLYYSSIGLILSIAIAVSAGQIVDRFDLRTDIRSDLIASVYLVSLNVLIQFVGLPFVAVLQGLHKFAVTKSVSAVLNITQYLLLIGVTVMYNRVDVAFFCIVIVTGVRTIVQVVIYYNLQHSDFILKFDKPIFLELWRSSNPLFFNRLIGLIYNHVGKFLIWIRLPIAQMGVFEVVNKPSALIKVLVGMVYSAIIPEVAKLSQLNNFAAIKLLYINLIRYSLLLIMPVIVLICVHASNILNLWIGSGFNRQAMLVQLLMLSMIIYPFASIGSTIVVGLGMVGRTVWIPILGTLVNVIISFVLIDELELMGLILAMLTAEIIICIPYTNAMCKILKIDLNEIFKPVFNIMLISILMATLQYFVAMTASVSITYWALIITVTAIHYVVEISLLSGEESDFLKRRFAFTK